MADLSQIKLPNNSTYNLKDAKAREDFDNLKIGGRNLLFLTKDFATKSGQTNGGYLSGTSMDTREPIVSETYKGLAVRHFMTSSIDAATYYDLVYNNLLIPVSGKSYVFSFYAKGTGKIRTHFYPNTSGGTYKNTGSQGQSNTATDGNTDFTVSSDWQRFWVRFEIGGTQGTNARHALLRVYGGNDIYVCGLKFEESGKATDWTPAPEDVDASIAAVPRMSKINMASRSFTTNQWKTYGSRDHVENWTTGAFYNNSHLRIGDHAYMVGTISDQNGGTATIIGEVTNVQPAGSGTSYVTLKSEQLIFGGDIVSDIESRVSTAETTIAQTSQQIDNLSIGGRNLLTNAQANWRVGSLNSGIYSTSGNQICPTNGLQGMDFKIPIEPNAPYVVRGWSELTDYPTLFVGVHQLDENLAFLNDSSWKQITGTGYSFTSLSNAAYVRVTFKEQTYSVAGANAVVSAMGNAIRIKFEKGNRATDWTPAPEDKADIADIGILESPYKEVEWVESDGRSFVMLDWKPTPSNWGFDLDFSTIDKFSTGHTTASLGNIHTASTDYASSIFGTCNTATSANDYRLGTYDYTDGVVRSGNNNKYHAKLYSDGRRQQCSLRGNIYTGADGSTTTITRNGSAAKWNMVVFGNTQSGSSLWCTNPGSHRIYSLKFYDGDTLAVDLVGAYRKADGCTGLWDKIGEHFYPAAGMAYGNDVGDVGKTTSIIENIQSLCPQLVTTNVAATRLWTAKTTDIFKLVDGQQIILRNRFGTATEAQATELAYYTDSGSSANVYLKLTLADGSSTDWIPCYYSNTARLTTHYGAGSEIRFVYREDVVSGTTALIRGWWADANYNTNDNTINSPVYYACMKTGSKPAPASCLSMLDSTGKLQPICTASDGTVATTATTKIPNPVGFRVGSQLFLNTTAYSANANLSAASVLWSMYTATVVDARLAFNVTRAADQLIPYEQIYLVGTIGSDGLYYLDSVWWTQTPNDVSKVYVYVGGAYDSTASNVRFVMHEQNPWYVYDGTKLVEFDDQRIHTAENKLAGIASGAEVNQNAFSNIKVGSTTVSADIKTDTLELAGSNVTLTPDATNDKVTIGITASNVTTALGNTAVARATGDASGNAIASTYVKKSGDTMSGLLTLKADQYDDSYTSGALNLSNSNIYGVNSVYTADLSDDSKEGIHFYRDSTHVDSLWAKQGTLYFTPNRALNDTGTSYAVLNASSNVSEANLVWGGKNFTASYGPIDAAMVTDLGANRIACISGDAVTIEYSRDKGETWTDYGATKAQKGALFAQGNGFVIGKADSTNKATANGDLYQLRVTIDTGAANVYTILNKFVFYVSTNGSNSCVVKIEKALQSTPTTFVNHTGDVPIAGWSGWNVVNTSGLTTYGNDASSQYGRLRFIFKANGGNTSYAGLSVGRIMAFGGVGWNAPSNMARTGHAYTYDQDQNVTFPASLKTTGDITIGNNTTSSIVNSGIQVNDVRNASLSPTIIDHAANLYFHSTDGPTTEWWSILHVKGWEGGYSAWELAGPSHNVDQRTTPLYVRSSNVNSEWGSWRKIFDSAQTIPAANGGTGQTSLNASANSFINSLTTGADVPKDADYYICQYANGGTSTTTYHRRPTSKIYDYIVGKSKNLTAIGNLGWTTQDAGKMPLLVNGIAYWNGQYKSGSSNLQYCKLGEFKNGAISERSTSVSSTSESTVATSSAVKQAYDLANSANGTANSALSGVNGSYIYDHTYTISNGVATFTAHVYLKGEEVTSTFADSCFTWSYKLADSVTGTPSIVSLGTGKTKTITISTLGYGGYVQGTFTPPSS